MLRMLKPNSIILHKTKPQVGQEIQACIGCNECLLACPAVGEPITIDVLNRETLSGNISASVWRVRVALPRWLAPRCHDDVAQGTLAYHTRGKIEL